MDWSVPKFLVDAAQVAGPIMSALTIWYAVKIAREPHVPKIRVATGTASATYRSKSMEVVTVTIVGLKNVPAAIEVVALRDLEGRRLPLALRPLGAEPSGGRVRLGFGEAVTQYIHPLGTSVNGLVSVEADAVVGLLRSDAAAHFHIEVRCLTGERFIIDFPEQHQSVLRASMQQVMSISAESDVSALGPNQ